MHDGDDWQDGEEDWLESEGSDADDDFVACPICGEPVHEEAQRCPHCENYITPGMSSPQGRPLWFRIALLLAGLIVVYWLIGGLL
ncbi:MAG: hypothetical protein D6753_18325 [Planctomycetota bacterium]|nr:MAG: hypothetical protein D6753_18325 [Planctomycetota bacterium]